VALLSCRKDEPRTQIAMTCRSDEYCRKDKNILSKKKAFYNEDIFRNLRKGE
jgi:hypothetical protein